MSLDWRKRILGALLLGFALWPLVHHVLVARYEINPWRFFGLAMYSRPWNQVSLRFYEAVPGGALPIDPLSLSALRAERARFVEARTDYGRLVRPDRLARGLFDLDPQRASVVIEVRNLLLDPETARFRPSVQRYRYVRGQDGPAPES